MFKKLASDALGLSDIGRIINRENFKDCNSDDYVLTEDQEEIYFLIKSKTDEYCFTNKALIHLDGTSAASSKRNLKRYDYFNHQIRDVSIETAGTLDKDLEIKFSIGNIPFSIDIDKTQATETADLYKTLVAIALIQEEQELRKQHFAESLAMAQSVIVNHRTVEADVSNQFQGVTRFTFNWLNDAYEQNTRRCFKEVFLKYIQN